VLEWIWKIWVWTIKFSLAEYLKCFRISWQGKTFIHNTIQFRLDFGEWYDREKASLQTVIIFAGRDSSGGQGESHRGGVLGTGSEMLSFWRQRKRERIFYLNKTRARWKCQAHLGSHKWAEKLWKAECQERRLWLGRPWKTYEHLGVI
jgi:hypothetical protein